MLAELLRVELPGVVADPSEASTVDAALAAALARPEGTAEAGRALRRAFGSTRQTSQWLAARLGMDTGDIRSRLMSAGEDAGVPARFLTAETPAAIGPGEILPIQVAITEQARDHWARCRPFAVPPGGVGLHVMVSPGPGLTVDGPPLHPIRVPERGDSERVLFLVRHDGGPAPHNGVASVAVRAFVGGRIVADLTVDCRIAADARTRSLYTTATGRASSAGIGSVDPDRSHLTLAVDPDRDGYECHLFHDGDNARGVVAQVPTQILRAVTRHLRAMASGTLRQPSAAMGRHHLHDLGFELWDKALPAGVRHRFDDLLAGAKTLSILTSGFHSLPWELLLPAPCSASGREFLSECVPVVRRVPGQTYPARIRVADAAYVRPPAAPPDTDSEILSVQHALGLGVRHRLPAFTDHEDLVRYLDGGQFDLLHLACHNSAPNASWDYVNMSDGEFYRINLNQAVADQLLGDRHPLVFFNACDTVGRATDTAMTGWANSFLRAGAGAFIGSTWAVRSKTATRFATALYDALADHDLAKATMCARRVTAESDDPTRLAYAVYATVGTEVRWSER
jgi:hypothetical protein